MMYRLKGEAGFHLMLMWFQSICLWIYVFDRQKKMFEKKKKVVFQEVFGKARAAGLVNP